jgi:hypothetical protein
MKNMIVVILLFICVYAYAENKVYRFNNKEVVDVSGIKTLEEISAEFGGTARDWIDVTPVPPTAEEIAAQEALAKKKSEREALIREKVEAIAVAELIKDGKLDEDGQVGVEVKP